MNFRILFQDSYIVAIDKPSGFHVHPPEDSNHKISNQFNCLYLLKQQLGTYLYPVHRLDRATSGVLLFALQPESAKTLCSHFQNQTLQKTYYCVVRGWTEPQGFIDHPLKTERPNSGTSDAQTSYQRLAKIELPHAVGRYTTARYSLLKVKPHTGRHHQIRRHLDHLSHPLVGDSIYGNSEHNQFYKNTLEIPGLLLKAYSISFSHPATKNSVYISSRWGGQWHRIFDLFGVCPWQKNEIFNLEEGSYATNKS